MSQDRKASGVRTECVDLAVLGIGNEIRLDDAVGIHVGRKVAGILGCAFYDMSSVDLELLDVLERHRLIALVDAAHLARLRPGEWVEADASELGPSRVASAHGRVMGAVLGAARASGVDVDGRVRLFAMAVERTDEFGEGLSPEVEGAVDPAARQIAQRLRAWAEEKGGGAA